MHQKSAAEETWEGGKKKKKTRAGCTVRGGRDRWTDGGRVSKSVTNSKRKNEKEGERAEEDNEKTF